MKTNIIGLKHGSKNIVGLWKRDSASKKLSSG